MWPTNQHRIHITEWQRPGRTDSSLVYGGRGTRRTREGETDCVTILFLFPREHFYFAPGTTPRMTAEADLACFLAHRMLTCSRCTSD